LRKFIFFRNILEIWGLSFVHSTAPVSLVYLPDSPLKYLLLALFNICHSFLTSTFLFAVLYQTLFSIFCMFRTSHFKFEFCLTNVNINTAPASKFQNFAFYKTYFILFYFKLIIYFIYTQRDVLKSTSSNILATILLSLSHSVDLH